jgi:hypothetical protein
MRRGRALLLAAAAALWACGGGTISQRDGGADVAGPGHDATTEAGSGDGPAGDGTAGHDGGHDGGGDGGGGTVTAADLLALTSACNRLAGSTDFATDDGEADTVSICTLTGAVWWRADMDIDCDGGKSAACLADPWYQPETSATDSQGQPLDASTLPYVVVPLPSNGFDYTAAGLQLGSVVAVVFNGQLQYGIFGDEGPQGMIGEASYAMAVLFGIDPDPATGGSDGPVTYIAFTGSAAVVTHNEDHGEAVTVGYQRAADLVTNN